MIKRFNIFFFLIFILVSNFYGQDIFLSNYDAAPQYLNPALTGMYFGAPNDWRVNVNYSNQSIGSFSDAYNTAAIGYDKKLNKFGYGAFIINSVAGEGNYNVLNVLLSGAYEISIDKTFRHNLMVGLQLGVFHHSFNQSKLLFENQYDPSLGGFDQSVSNGESFTTTNVLRLDAGLGAYYTFRDKRKPINPALGFSIYHATSPSFSFYDYQEKEYYPIKFIINGDIGINITENLQITPKVFYITQGKESFLDMSIFSYYSFKGSKQDVLGGVSVNTNDIIYIHGGMKFGYNLFRLSYGFNSFLQKSLISARNEIELSIIIVKRRNSSPSFH